MTPQAPDNFHAAVELELVCPRCGEINRLSASHQIAYDARLQLAVCATCAHAGPVNTFTPKGATT